MIAGAALLVLLGLGLFVAGILTGLTALYWACVAACVVAAVLLVVVRRKGAAAEPAAAAPTEGTAEAAAPGDSGARVVAPGTTAPGESDSANGATGATTAQEAAPTPADLPDPGIEEVEVTDLLIVVDLKDEVLVVDEHPRYHVAECSWLAGRETIPLPLDEARVDGFTPCAVCSPDRTLAERARQRKHTAGS